MYIFTEVLQTWHTKTQDLVAIYQDEKNRCAKYSLSGVNKLEEFE